MSLFWNGCTGALGAGCWTFASGVSTGATACGCIGASGVGVKSSYRWKKAIKSTAR
ncbi:hypothetical protein BN128_2614 [Cronobacter sakazakii 696]|nr:hypothetical protein BN128_2614 [Cronobacter sakazakii 696]